MIDDELGGHSPATEDSHTSTKGTRSGHTGDNDENKEGSMPPEPEADLSGPASDAEAKREKRRRLRMLKGIFKALDIQDEDALALIRDLNDLLPPEQRMSTGKDVAERLEKVLRDDNKAPPGLLFTISGETPLDITDTERTFRDNRRLAVLLDNEEGLFRALILNERVRAGLSRQVAEHDAAKRMLLAELVRRYTLSEQWRYLLPKYVLPVFSVLHEAKIRRDDLREGSKLLERIIDAVCDFKGGAVSRETLVAAAKKTDEQFERILASENSPAVDSMPEEQPHEESDGDWFSKAKRRRQTARLVASGFVKPSAVEAAELAELTPEAAEERKATLNTLEQWEAGLDEHMRPVFESMDQFAEREKFFREHYASGAG